MKFLNANVSPRRLMVMLEIGTLLIGGVTYYYGYTGQTWWGILWGIYFGFNFRALIHQYSFVKRMDKLSNIGYDPATIVPRKTIRL